MNLKLIISLLLIIGCYQVAYAQINSNNNIKPIFFSSRIGLNSFNELNIQFEFPTFKKSGLELYLGYNYGSRILEKSETFCSNENISLLTRKTGPIIKIGKVFYRKNAKGIKAIHLLADFRISQANSLQVCPPRLGTLTNGDIINELDWDTKDIGFMVYFDRAMPVEEIAGFYVGLGVLVRSSAKIFRKDLYPTLTPPADEILTYPIFSFDLGMRIGKRRKLDLPQPN